MAELTQDQAIEKLRGLSPDKQRLVLQRLTPEARKGILTQLTQKTPTSAAQTNGAQSSTASQPSFWGTVRQHVNNWWQRERSYGSPTDPTHSNVDAAFFNTLAGVPEFAKDVAGQARDVVTGRERPEELLNTLDPGNVIQGLQTQFETDWNQGGAGFAAQKMLGTLAAMGLISKVAHAAGEKGLSKVGELRARTAERVRSAAQDVLGAGKPFVRNQVEDFGNTSARIREANRTATEKTLANRGKVDEANAVKLAKHRADVEKVREQNRNATAETLVQREKVNQKNVGQLRREAKARIDALKQNREATQAHEADKAEVRTHNQEELRQQRNRQDTEQKLQTASRDLESRIEKARTSAKAENDAAWDAWREKTSGAEVPSDNIVNEIKAQRGTTLNDPADLAEFRTVLKETRPDPTELAGTLDAVTKGQGGTTYDAASPQLKSTVDDIIGRLGLDPDEETGPKPVDANRLHLWKQQLEYAVRRAGRGNVRYALGQVLDQVRSAEDQLSADSGAKEQLQKARELHGRFVDTFRNSPNEPQTVASKSFSEQVPEYSHEQAARERLAMLGHYDPEIPKLASHIQNMRQGLKALPESARLKENPPAPEMAPRPEGQPLTEYAEPQAHTTLPAQPEMRPYEEPEATLPLPKATDLTAARQEQMRARLQRFKGLSPWEARILAGAPIEWSMSVFSGHPAWSLVGKSLLVGELAKQLLVRIVERGSILDFLSKPTQRDLDLINSLPARDAARLRDALGGLAGDEAREFPDRAHVSIAPAMAVFLGGASTSGERRIPRNRREALERLGRTTPSASVFPFTPGRGQR